MSAVDRKSGNIDVTFQVTEGPLNVVQDLRIEGNNTLSEAQFAPHGLNLGPGKPYSQELIIKDRNAILARYLTLGYLNAGFRATAKPVPNLPHHLDVVYRIDEGPQVTTATIITVGKQHTQQSLIDKQLQDSNPDEPLSENGCCSSESPSVQPWHLRLGGSRSQAEHHRPDQEDVVVKVHEAKRNSIVYGFGFQVLNRGGSIPSGTVAVPGIPPVGLPKNFVTSQKTFWGPDGTFEYTRRNHSRTSRDSCTFSAFAGRLDQRASLTYTDPYFHGTSWTGSAILSGEHDAENPDLHRAPGKRGLSVARNH